MSDFGQGWQENYYYKNVVEGANDNKVNLWGVYRAYVEYVNDPMQVGRVLVRIPALHGTPEQTPTNGLPWAYVVNSFGGGHDFGSKMIPPVGTTVFIMFEGGDKHYPVVIGTWDGNPSSPVEMGRNPDHTLPDGKISMSPDPKTPWKSQPGADSPKEFLIQSNNSPERYVPFKSPKGAVVDIEDRDEVEHTHILDRTGQGIFFEGPVKTNTASGGKYPANKGNLAQRGLSSSLHGDALPLESTPVNEASVVIIDLGSQSVTLRTKEDANSILLSSKQSTVEEPTVGGNKEVPGKANANLELASGHKIVNLEVTNNGVAIAKITLNGTLGVVTIDSPLLTKISSETIVLEGDVSISGNLSVDKTITCFENGLFVGEVESLKDTGKAVVDSITAPVPV